MVCVFRLTERRYGVDSDIQKYCVTSPASACLCRGLCWSAARSTTRGGAAGTRVASVQSHWRSDLPPLRTREAREGCRPSLSSKASCVLARSRFAQSQHLLYFCVQGEGSGEADRPQAPLCIPTVRAHAPKRDTLLHNSQRHTARLPGHFTTRRSACSFFLCLYSCDVV